MSLINQALKRAENEQPASRPATAAPAPRYTAAPPPPPVESAKPVESPSALPEAERIACAFPAEPTAQTALQPLRLMTPPPASAATPAVPAGTPNRFASLVAVLSLAVVCLFAATLYIVLSRPGPNIPAVASASDPGAPPAAVPAAGRVSAVPAETPIQSSPKAAVSKTAAPAARGEPQATKAASPVIPATMPAEPAAQAPPAMASAAQAALANLIAPANPALQPSSMPITVIQIPAAPASPPPAATAPPALPAPVATVPTVPTASTLPEKPQPAPPEAAQFKLGGIMQVGTGGHAIINNQLVTAGEEVDGAKVVAIRKYDVTLEKNGVTIVLKMKG